jgi:PKHD-type hydroxylase
MINVIESVLSPEDLARVLELAGAAEFKDGRLTAGYRADRVKTNEQIARQSDAEREIGLIVLSALDGNRSFQRYAMPRFAAPPLVSRYRPGMRYGAHVDEPLSHDLNRIRRDLALTLFLSPADSYAGGDLVVETPLGERAVRLGQNAAVLYPADTVHRVNEVTRGERLAVVTWVQSHVREQHRRTLLIDMLSVAEKLHQLDPDGATTNVAYKSWSNLMRMWAEN